MVGRWVEALVFGSAALASDSALISLLKVHPELAKLLKEGLAGAKNGAFFCIKARLPDVILVSLLSNNRNRSLLETVRRATYIACKQTVYLSCFAFCYRLLMAFMKFRSGGISRPLHAFLGAAFSSVFIYKHQTPDNMQLLFFFLARILPGCLNSAVSRGLLPQSRSWFFPLVFALSTGVGFTLFENEPKNLTPNFRHSLDYIYHHE